MTYEQADHAARVLDEVAIRGNLNTLDWIALVEDTLRNVLPDNSQLLARFDRIKAETSQESLEKLGPQQLMEVEQKYKGVIRAASELMKNLVPKSDPNTTPNLDEQLDWALKRGYFKSWPFRIVMGLLLLALVLITGVSSFKMYDQIQAMQKLLDDAKTKVSEAHTAVSQANEQVTQAKSEIANRQAEMALMVLRGAADLDKMGTEARHSLENARSADLDELKNKTATISSDLDAAEKSSVRQVDERTKKSLDEIGAIEKMSGDKITDRVQSILQNLEAAKRPWIPLVAWSIAKRWLVLPLALLISCLAWIYAALNGWGSKPFWVKIVAVGNMLVLLVIAVVVYIRL